MFLYIADTDFAAKWMLAIHLKNYLLVGLMLTSQSALSRQDDPAGSLYS